MYDHNSTLDNFIFKKRKEIIDPRKRKEYVINTPRCRIEKTDWKNLFVVRIGRFRPNNFLNSLWYKKHIKPALKELKDHKILNYKDTLYYTTYFWRYFDPKMFKTVLQIYDFAFPVYNQYSSQLAILNSIRKIQYWNALRPANKCEKILAISEHTKKDIMKFLPGVQKNRVEVVTCGIERIMSYNKAKDYLLKEKNYKPLVSSKYLPADWKDKGYLIHLGGGVAMNKNPKGVIDGYLEFIKKIEKKHPNKIPYLLLAGKIFKQYEISAAMELKDYIENLALDQLIYYTGYYSNTEKVPLLVNSFAFIHLSLYEGFGLSLGEAMTCGVPVIAHKGTSYIEVVGDSGILVNGSNPKDVGNAIYRLWSSKRDREKYGLAGLSRVQEFSWSKNAKALYNVFTKIV